MALNSNSGVSDVLIEGGRATADPVNGVIRYNFYDSPKRQLTSATWFVKEEKSSKEFILLPMPTEDATLVEELYQRAVASTSSLGDGIDSVLQEEAMLNDDKYKIIVMKTGSIFKMKKKPKGWFGASYDLQRGYGHYEVEGEEEEMALGPVRHLVFVIHGIGEAMWSRNYVDFSLSNEVNRTRLAIQRKQLVEWKKECEKAKKTGYGQASRCVRGAELGDTHAFFPFTDKMDHRFRIVSSYFQLSGIITYIILRPFSRSRLTPQLYSRFLRCVRSRMMLFSTCSCT